MSSSRLWRLLMCCRGNLRRQNEKGHLIGHVKDVGIDSKHQNPVTRIYLTSVAQPWHVDGTDVVGESASLVHCSLHWLELAVLGVKISCFRTLAYHMSAVVPDGCA